MQAPPRFAALPALLLAVAPAAASPGGASGGDDQHQEEHHEIEMSPGARLLEDVEDHTQFFRPDPPASEYYIPEEQEAIYGGKHAVRTQRPLLELGRALYKEGPLQPGVDWLGEKNLLFPHFMVYGDWRFAAGANDFGREEVALLATRLNLDMDLKLTATERIHAFVRPLERDGEVTRWNFAGDNEDDFEDELEFDPNLEALFFEGDLGAIAAGATGEENDLDLPFTFGLIPFLVQNGVWIEDAFTGFAFTIPAFNSSTLDISNMDVTFFAGFDDVTTGAIADDVTNVSGNIDDEANIFGVTTFIDAWDGYVETGYGFTYAEDSSLTYHNLTAAYTRRYFGKVSNSVRFIWNLGQSGNGARTADGLLLLLENSLITSMPSNLVPYFNAFWGINSPQSLARAAGAGGVLKNTGLNFETDGVTGFPKLDDTGHDAVGGALGVEYLFGGENTFGNQVVVELAGQSPLGNDENFADNQVAFGVRYQKPLTNFLIFRADAMYGLLEGSDNDLRGIRFELRWKF